MPALCEEHDDRLGDLEKAQAVTAAKLEAGTEMFRGIQDSIRMLSTNVSNSMTRVENTVNRVADDVRDLKREVADIRVEQTKHASAISSLTAKKVEVDEEAKERKKSIREAATKVGLTALKVTAIIIIVRFGPEWLVSAVKMFVGG